MDCGTKSGAVAFIGFGILAKSQCGRTSTGVTLKSVSPFPGPAPDAKQRLMLLEMARAWTRLAEQRKKNLQSDLVYETPDQRSATPHQQQQIQPKKDRNQG